MKKGASKLPDYNLDSVAVKKSDGLGVVLSQQTNTHFYGNENTNHHLGAGFFYIRESYQNLRGQN
jgi:hypothetical protein